MQEIISKKLSKLWPFEAAKRKIIKFCWKSDDFLKCSKYNPCPIALSINIVLIEDTEGNFSSSTFLSNSNST